jgi:class 3 adenylate cyclase
MNDGKLQTYYPRRRVLTPADRLPPAFPRAMWLVLALAALALAARGLTAPPFNAILPAVGLAAGFVFGAGTATWLELHVFRWASAKGRWRRLAIAALTPWPVALGALIAIAVAEPLLVLAGLPGLAASALLGFALWYVGAALGSLVVRVIDEVVSSLFSSFRGRTIAGFTLLMALLLGATAWLALQMVGAEWQVAIGAGIKLDDDVPAPARALLEQLTASRANQLLAVFILSLLVSLPALMSALYKTGDATLDRLEPLAMAFDALAHGDRNVRVEVGGSREFQELGRHFNRMVDALWLSERVERAFGTYVSDAVLERIKAQHGAVLIPPSVRDATVFFADVRGFTAMSERLAPEALVAMLNRYLDRVVEVVSGCEGYLDKFIGDAVVVVFNGPIEQPDHAARAVDCAVALQAAVRGMNAADAFPEVGKLEVGIGVATGQMVAGNIGSAAKTEYTVIGDTVNLAARLCEQAPGGEIWLNRACRDAQSARAGIEAMRTVALKGKSAPVEVFRVTRAPAAGAQA